MGTVCRIQESELPNGGWGWMVVLGAALTNMFNQSLISVFGLLYGEELERMGYGTSVITLVANINNMVTCFSGLLIGPLLKKYSCRKVSVAGSFISAIGIIMSSFATSIYDFIFYYSFLTGLGLGLIYPSTFVAIKSYFTSKRGTAVGLSMAGTGLGQMLIPQVVRLLLDEYGFLWTTRIIGVLCLHGVAGSLLFQPVRWHLASQSQDSEKFLIGCYIQKLKKGNDENSNKPEEHKVDVAASKVGKQLDDVKGDNASGPWRRTLELLDLNLLKDPVFVNIAVGLGVAYTAGMTFGVLYPFFLLDNVGLNRRDTALCMSALSAMDIVGRVTMPSISKALGLSSRSTFTIGVLALAVARSVIAEVDTCNVLIVVSLACGYIRSASIINQNLTVSDYCRDEQLPAALGLVMVSKGLFVMTIGQLFGVLRDYTRSYSLCIHSTNALLVAVFAAWTCEMSASRLRRAGQTL